MLNIAQFIRRIVGVSVTQAEKDLHTEISEKRTTTLGYVLIFFMVIFGVVYGQTVLNDLQNSINYPTPPAQCISSLTPYIDNPDQAHYYDHSYYSYDENISCTTTDPRYTALYEQAKALENTVKAKEDDKSKAETDLMYVKNSEDEYRSDYDISLQEKQAGVPNTVQGTQQQYATGHTQVQIAQDNVNSASAALASAENSLSSFANQNKAAINEIQNTYDHRVLLVELERALLQLIFIAPIFWFTLRRYFIARDKGASTAIIWTGVTAIFGILFAQVICVFIYDILPHRLLEELFAWIAKMEWMLTLLRYLLLILVPAIFGFIVYQIQKRVYNSRAVFMRALKAHRCAKCGMSISPDMRHCPVCGNALKEPCTTGGHDRIAHAPFCDVCGKINE